MDIVRVKWFDNVTSKQHAIDYTSDDYACQTSMLTDIELVAATLDKCVKYQRKNPTHELLSIVIVAR